MGESWEGMKGGRGQEDVEWMRAKEEELDIRESGKKKKKKWTNSSSSRTKSKNFSWSDELLSTTSDQV